MSDGYGEFGGGNRLPPTVISGREFARVKSRIALAADFERAQFDPASDEGFYAAFIQAARMQQPFMNEMPGWQAFNASGFETSRVTKVWVNALTGEDVTEDVFYFRRLDDSSKTGWRYLTEETGEGTKLLALNATLCNLRWQEPDGSVAMLDVGPSPYSGQKRVVCFENRPAN